MANNKSLGRFEQVRRPGAHGCAVDGVESKGEDEHKRLRLMMKIAEENYQWEEDC